MRTRLYNEEQKERYLSEVKDNYAPDVIVNIRSLFNRVSEFEETLEKDVCNFSREEISNMYSLLMYSSKYVYSSVNSRLRAYVEWCLSQMLVNDGCNHFQEFSLDDFDKYINKRILANKYMDRETYEHILDGIPNPRDKFLIMCLYEFGKSQNFEDIFGMKIEDIDQEKGVIHLRSGRTVKVSKELIATAIETNNDPHYLMPGRGVYRNLLDSPYIFKRAKTSGDEIENIDNNNQNVKFVARLIKGLVEYVGENRGINATAIAESGQFEWIHHRAKELGITEKEYVLNHFDDLTSQYKTSPNNPKSYWNKYETYL